MAQTHISTSNGTVETLQRDNLCDLSSFQGEYHCGSRCPRGLPFDPAVMTCRAWGWSCLALKLGSDVCLVFRRRYQEFCALKHLLQPLSTPRARTMWLSASFESVRSLLCKKMLYFDCKLLHSRRVQLGTYRCKSLTVTGHPEPADTDIGQNFDH